jgi:hypothetical protein
MFLRHFVADSIFAFADPRIRYKRFKANAN